MASVRPLELAAAVNVPIDEVPTMAKNVSPATPALYAVRSCQSAFPKVSAEHGRAPAKLFCALPPRFVVLPLSLVLCAITPPEATTPLELPFSKLAFVDRAIREDLTTMAMRKVLQKSTLK